MTSLACDRFAQMNLRDRAHQFLDALLVEPSGSMDEAMRLLCEIVNAEEALDEVAGMCDGDTQKRQVLWDALDMYLTLECDVEDEPATENETEAVTNCRATIAAIRKLVDHAQDTVPRELLDWCDRAFTELDAPRTLEESVPPPNYLLSLLLSAPITPQDTLWIAAQADYFDGDVAPMRWASRSALGVSPTWLSIAMLEIAETVEFSATPPAAWLVPPLYRYHPERFKATRRYAKRLRDVHSYVGLPHEIAYRAAIDLVGNEMRLRAADFDQRIALEPAGKSKMWIRDIEVPLALTWANFVNAGRQVFELKPDLVEMLRHTSPGDVRISELRFPYPVFYLRFAAQADWQLAPTWMIEGCYVEHHPQQQLLIFRFTC